MRNTDSPSSNPPRLLPGAVEFVEGDRYYVVDELTGDIRVVREDETPQLDVATFKKLVQLPCSVAEELDLDELVATLAAEVEETGCLPPVSARLVAEFIVASWCTDSLPVAAVLCIHGDPGSDTKLRQLLSLTCRRSLHVGRASYKTLGLIPPGLHPTLLLNATKAVPVDLLESMTGAGGAVWDGGRIVENKSAVILYSPVPLPGMVSLFCDGNAVPYRSYSASECGRIRESFIPRLVHHRLRQHQLAAGSLFDIPTLSSEVRRYARAVGSAFAGHAALQGQLAADLEIVDDDLRAETSDSPETLVAEVMWQAAHGGKSEVSIAAITEGAYVSNRWRRSVVITSKKVGGVVRQLGIIPRRRGAGYFVEFDTVAQRALHLAARRLGLLACPRCKCCGDAGVPADRFRPAPHPQR